MVHGDDFVATGPVQSLRDFTKAMKDKYPIKSSMIHKETKGESILALNRRIYWTDDGIVYAHDPRHVDVLINDLDLAECKPVATPACDGSKQPDDDEGLSWSNVKLFQSCVARCNYLAQDRTDIAYAVNELCQSMSSPNNKAFRKLKRLARYLKGEREWQLLIPFDVCIDQIIAYTDSDWAGDQATRKSVSSAALCLRCRGQGTTPLVKHVVRKQKVIAKSSAEAELYAAGMTASEALGVKALFNDLGVSIDVTLCIDAQATMHMLHREGIGRAKHIEVGYLWIQEAVRRRRLVIRKVGTKHNVADVGTKPLDKESIFRHCKTLGFTIARSTLSSGH